MAATERTSTTLPANTTTTTDPSINDERFASVAATIDEFVRDNDLNGATLVVVTRDDGVVWIDATGELGPDRISLVASAGKMITAGVLLRLQDEGLIDLDAPIAEAVPWGVANPSVTVAHLLSNSSGLVGLLQEPFFRPYLCQYLATGTVQDCGRTIFTTPLDDALVVPPDTEFRYGGGQWQVAGAVAEAVSGRTWAQLVDETYVQPCGTTSLGYNNQFTQFEGLETPFSYPAAFDGDPSTMRPTDNPNMEAGAYLTPRDYSTLLLMHLRGGRCGDHRALSEAAVAQAHTDRIGPAGTRMGEAGYGLGWWIHRDEPTLLQDDGAYGTIPWIDLRRGYGAVLVLEAETSQGRQLVGQIRPMIDDVVAELH